jgi:hypothetical protein
MKRHDGRQAGRRHYQSSVLPAPKAHPKTYCEPHHIRAFQIGQQCAYRMARADFNIRTGQGRLSVIFRRRPCFLRWVGPEAAPIWTDLSQAGDLPWAEITAQWAF